MEKELTITLDSEVYDGLQAVIGPEHISSFIESLVRPHVIGLDLDAPYEAMAAEERREDEAKEWAEATIRDVADDPR